MCGMSRAIIQDKDVFIMFGYRGGTLRIGKDFEFKDKMTKKEYEEAFTYLVENYDKEDLVKLILDLTVNAEEA